MNARALLLCAFMALVLPMFACGEVQTVIHESSIHLNTTDTQGPYEVLTIITSNTQPLTAQLVYTTDNWKTTKKVKMTKVPTVGEDVYRGKLPGQKVGTTIQYYIEVSHNGEKLQTDPTIVPPQPKGIAYKFTILPSN